MEEAVDFRPAAVLDLTGERSAYRAAREGKLAY